MKPKKETFQNLHAFDQGTSASRLQAAATHRRGGPDRGRGGLIATKVEIRGPSVISGRTGGALNEDQKGLTTYRTAGRRVSWRQ